MDHRLFEASCEGNEHVSGTKSSLTRFSKTHTERREIMHSIIYIVGLVVVVVAVLSFFGMA